MHPRFSIRILPLLLLAGILGATAQSQEKSPAPTISDDGSSSEPDTAPPPRSGIELDISRRSLKNFLTDEIAATPYRDTDGALRDLPSVFTVGSLQAQFVAIWDPESCRLLGVLDLKTPEKTEVAPSAEDTEEDEKPESPPSPYVMIAEGLPPLHRSAGASGTPQYFGFRLSGEIPEFLYTHGNLAVEEALWLEENGTVLVQRFAIRDPKSNVSVVVPAHWKERAESSAGAWKENVLTVEKEAAAEFSISYRLTGPEPAPAPEN